MQTVLIWLSILLIEVQHIDSIMHLFLCMYQEEDSLPSLMKQFLLAFLRSRNTSPPRVSVHVQNMQRYFS